MNQSRNAVAVAEPLLERPLSARSVMGSLLLGMDPPRIPGALLVRWCELFGISEGTARVALHRMTGRGELTAGDGVYELAGRLAERQRQQEWSLHPQLREWSGEWVLAVVTSEARDASERQALRRAMPALHHAELREGVWTRPDNLPAGEAQAVLERQCMVWRGRPDDDPMTLADRLFAPERWAARAMQLLDRVDAVIASLQDGDAGLDPDGFVTGAATLRHVRADPLLPAALLPAGWPGDALRAAYGAYRERFGDAATEWFRRQATLSSTAPGD